MQPKSASSHIFLEHGARSAAVEFRSPAGGLAYKRAFCALHGTIIAMRADKGLEERADSKALAEGSDALEAGGEACKPVSEKRAEPEANGAWPREPPGRERLLLLAPRKLVWTGCGRSLKALGDAPML